LAAFENANHAGGVHGRHLKLICEDDGYEPSQTVHIVRRLIEKENVLALIGNVGTPTAVVTLPILTEDHTLLFAPFTGAGILRLQPPNRYVINYRASYKEEITQMIDALIEKAGLKLDEIAFFTQRDSYGDAGFKAGLAALEKHGLKNSSSILHVRYERNTLAVENALADMILAKTEPKAVIMVGSYAPCAKFIQLSGKNGFHPLFLNVSFVGSELLEKSLAKTNERVIVTQVVPFPTDTSIPLIKEYLRDLKQVDAKCEPTFGSLEGYIAGKILIRALTRIESAPTRENLIDALLGLSNFDIGLGTQLHLSASEHQASHQIWVTILKNGKCIPYSWTALPQTLNQKSLKP